MLVLMVGCSNEKSQEEIPNTIPVSASREVKTTKATIMDIQKTELLDAQISPTLTEYTFQMSGKLEKFMVKLGDTVKAGDVLATLETSDMEEQVEVLQEELAELRKSYNHDVNYYEQKIMILSMKMEDTTLDQVSVLEIESEKEKYHLLLTQAKEKYILESTKKEDDLAELNDQISKNSIVASNDGTVVYINTISKGDYVDDSVCYLAITDESAYYMYCDYIGETTIGRLLRIYGLKDNKEYEITYIPMDGELYNKLKLADYDVYTSFLVNEPDESIQYGESAKIVKISEEALQVVAIPKIAIHSDTLGKFVYQNVDDARVKTYIKIGITDNVNTEVIEGLKEGDEIYVE